MENNLSVRAFVCVSLPESVVGEVAGFVDGLRGFAGFRWVSRDQLHVTLKFLGDVSPGQVSRLDTNFSRLGDVRPFAIKTSGAGGFPSLDRAKTLWLGVGEGGAQLGKLASMVDKAAVRAGCEAERRGFHPHITIARARAENGFGVTRELASRLSEAPLVSWECRGFTLARSVLAPGGAIYSPLGSYPG